MLGPYLRSDYVYNVFGYYKHYYEMTPEERLYASIATADYFLIDEWIVFSKQYLDYLLSQTGSGGGGTASAELMNEIYEIESWLADIYNQNYNLTGYITTKLTNLGYEISYGFDQLWEQNVVMMNAIQDGFNSLTDSMLMSLSDILYAIIDGITYFGETIAGAIQTLIAKLLEGFFKLEESIGDWFLSGITVIEGVIANSVGYVVQKFSEIFSDLVQGFYDMFEYLSDLLLTPIEDIADSVADLIDWAKSLFTWSEQDYVNFVVSLDKMSKILYEHLAGTLRVEV
ncbi:MAG: hypothetical protein QXQ02_03115 [Halobacteria archaeon]